jgi:DNA-binding transcriptional regulator GbsR (MarR family)
MFDHKDKGFRGDLYKIVPDYSKTVDEIVRPQTDDIKAGKAEAASVAAELEKKANDALAAAKAKFESQLK